MASCKEQFDRMMLKLENTPLKEIATESQTKQFVDGNTLVSDFGVQLRGAIGWMQNVDALNVVPIETFVNTSNKVMRLSVVL